MLNWLQMFFLCCHISIAPSLSHNGLGQQWIKLPVKTDLFFWGKLLNKKSWKKFFEHHSTKGSRRADDKNVLKFHVSLPVKEQFMVCPRVHAPLLDVLLCFHCHKVALVVDISQMHHTLLLPEVQHDLHCFICWTTTDDTLWDCQITRLTFGSLALSFTTNM